MAVWLNFYSPNFKDRDDLSDTATLTNSMENLSVGDSDGTAELDSDKELDTDSQQELGEWLGQLQALSDELDAVRPSPYVSRNLIGGERDSGVAGTNLIGGELETGGAMIGAAVESQAGGSGVVKPRAPKPAVPPKPPMDSFRYSMVNMEDSPESDLDALLQELCQLENQLKSGAPVNHLFANLGNDFLANSSASRTSSSSSVIGNQKKSPTTVKHQQPTGTYCSPMGVSAPSPVAENDQRQQGLLTVDTSAMGQKVSVIHQQQQMGRRNVVLLPQRSPGAGEGEMGVVGTPSSVVRHQGEYQGQGVTPVSNGYYSASATSQGRSGSPDADSAFYDTSSMLSSESAQSSGVQCRSSSNGSSESSRASLNTPSPTQLSDNVQAQIRSVQEDLRSQNLSEAEQNARLKAEKIKIALEKMKEASIKKLYVKFFTQDGGSKSLLVDERWTVSHILRHLADKNRQPLTTSCAVVEHYPDLFMERIYEDHELLVENILLWTRDSANKLLFLERQDKYGMFEEPQMYLCAETSAERKTKLDAGRKQQLVESSKDLVQLMNLEMIQIYSGLGWKKKYKAPTDFGFALKMSPLNCVKEWKEELENVKNGKQLLDNYEGVKTYLESEEGKSATVSLKSSASAENCSAGDGGGGLFRESVVMRPRSAAAGDHTEVKVRPRSADIMRGGQKRNSRTLMQVELPTIPSEPENFYSEDTPPYQEGIILKLRDIALVTLVGHVRGRRPRICQLNGVGRAALKQT